MEGGFVLDTSDSDNKQAVWVEGAPEPTPWTGLKLKGRRKIPMYAWRCLRCGLVRLFAPEI